MNPILKEHLVSALQTFLATFLFAMGTELSQGVILWTGTFWMSIIMVAVRAGVKEVFARFASPSLGGRVKV